MTRTKLFACSTAILTVICAGVSATSAQLQTSAKSATNDELLAKASVLPRADQWTLVPPERRDALREVVKAATEQRDALAKMDDPRARGLAVFIADQQGDVAALLSYAPLLADTRPTLPYAMPTAGVDEYATGEQTVAEYLTAAYLRWFGVDVDGSLERFKMYFGEQADASRLVKPWVVRLRRASSDAVRTVELKTRIQALPEDVRWAVIVLGYQESVYSPRDARDALRQLSAGTRQTLATGTARLAGEPYLELNEGAMAKLLLANARALLSGGQP